MEGGGVPACDAGRKAVGGRQRRRRRGDGGSHQEQQGVGGELHGMVRLVDSLSEYVCISLLCGGNYERAAAFSTFQSGPIAGFAYFIARKVRRSPKIKRPPYHAREKQLMMMSCGSSKIKRRLRLTCFFWLDSLSLSLLPISKLQKHCKNTYIYSDSKSERVLLYKQSKTSHKSALSASGPTLDDELGSNNHARREMHARDLLD